MSFTHVNTDVYRDTTSGQASWTINAGTVGDLRIIGTVTHSTTVNVSAISGGGVTTWTRAGSVFTSGSGRRLEIWYGRITGTGTAVTFTFSGTIGSTQFRSNVQDFRPSGGSGVTFAVQATNTATNASSSTYTFPSLTSVNAGELYFAHGHVGDSASAGSTPGFTYVIDANGNPRCYNGNLAAATNYAPTGPHVASASYFIGAIFAEVNPNTNVSAQEVTSAATVNAPVPSLRITPRQIGV